MGLMASAKCGSCNLTAEQLFLDVGRSFVFTFVANALCYCPQCETLSTEYRLKSAESIRAVAKYLGNGRVDAQNLVELAEAIAVAIDHRCGTCRAKQKAVRYSIRSSKAAKCPRCSERALWIEPAGIWD